MIDEIHDGSHPSCTQCFREKLRTIQFEGLAAQKRRYEDKTFSADMDAYKRLRDNGVQPKHIGGSAEIEGQAMTKFEAERGVIMSDPVRRQFKQRIQDAQALSGATK